MTALITPLDLSNTSTLTLKGHAQKTNETVGILNDFIANTSLSGQILTLNSYVNATFAKNTYVNATFATTTYTNQYANASNMLLRLKTVDGSGSGLDADLLDGQNSTYYRDLTNATGTIPDGNLPSRIKQVVPTVTDANTIGASGWYFILNTGTNIPETDHGYVLQFTQNDGSGTNADVQFWFSANTDKVYKRQRWYSATWQAWKRCHLTEDELDARYLQIANLLTQIKTVDGSGSGLDADLLDGQQGTYYSNLANATGTIPDANLPARLKFGASPAVTDCNDAVLSGFYFTANNPANAPMTGYGYLIVAGLDAAGRCKQIWHQYQSTQPRSFERDQHTVGVWSDWVETTSNKPYLDSRYLDITNMTGTIPNVNLPGRLQTVCTVITDWNSATENGWYKANNAANAPSSTLVGTTAWIYGRVECYASTYVIQTVWPASSGVTSTNTQTAMRVCINGTWGAWFKCMISQEEMDNRYLGISATATNSSALGGIAAANYARLNTSVTFSGLTVNGDTTSSAFVSPSTNVIVSPTGAGSVYLRPNGRNSGTGQAVINSAGNITISGQIGGATDINASGTIKGSAVTATGTGSFATVTTSGAATINGTLTTTNIQSTGANLIVGGGGAIFFRPLGVGNATNQSYFTGAQLVLPADPTTAMAAATKQYVDTNGAKTDYQVFTANGTWTKPAGLDDNSLVFVEAWGGGGGGATSDGAGGGGGAYVFHIFRASELSATVAVTVGAGGAKGNGAQNGGNSTFGSYMTAYGGGGGDNETNHAGGAGGGWLSAGNWQLTSPTGAFGGKPAGTGFGGGNGGGTSSGYGNGDDSAYGGGGGAGMNSNFYGGSSIFGGGGGANQVAKIGTSLYGGNGGSNGVDGSAPGGGGGYNANGARGEVRVTVIGK